MITSSSGKEKKTRERRSGKEKQKGNRGVTAFPWCVRLLTIAYIYQCGLQVRAHPALAHPTSSAAINMHFPTNSNLKVAE